MARQTPVDKEMLVKLEANRHLMAEYVKALQHADSEATSDALMKAIDTISDEFCMILGLSDEEIARINRESEAAVDAQIEAEKQAFIMKAVFGD